MPCFYVPTVLVVDAADEIEACSIVEEIVDHLVDLQPKGLVGNVVPDNTCSSPAPSDWFNRDASWSLDDDDNIIVIE